MINTISQISTACDGQAPPFEPEWTSPGRIVHRAAADGMAADQEVLPASGASAAAAGPGVWHWHEGGQSLAPAGIGEVGRA